MIHRTVHSKQKALRYSVLCLGFILVILSSATLAGCQPAAEATPPPATAVAESQATATQPAANPTTPVAADNTTSPTKVEETSTEKKSFQLTILHTNDTYGEVDPCG